MGPNEVARFKKNQLCNHMVDVLVKCQHSSFQTHHYSFCIEKGFHVVVA